MDVALIQWPKEEDRRRRLAAGSRPRLLLVASHAEPPIGGDLLEDWVRLPAPDGDVRARVRSLEIRIAEHQPPEPRLSGRGVLRHGPHSVTLTPTQTRLVQTLIANLGTVVSRDQLVQAGWPEGPPARNTVDVHVARLRGRLAAAGLALRTVRSRGFLLDRESGT